MGRPDPVADGLDDEEDLYDVAEWDSRTVTDAVAVALYGALHATKQYGLVLFGVLLFVAQLAFAGLLLVREPRLGILALLSAVPALALVAYVWYDDPTRREPIVTLAITFVLSVLFASFAALVNSIFQVFFTLIPVVAEELV